MDYLPVFAVKRTMRRPSRSRQASFNAQACVQRSSRAGLSRQVVAPARIALDERRVAVVHCDRRPSSSR